MPKYKVCLQQYVEEIAEMEVEAPDEKTARDIAKDHADEAEWRDGTDCYAAEVYAMKDADDKIIWER